MTRIQDSITVEERMVLGESKQLTPFEYLVEKPFEFIANYLLVVVMIVFPVMVFGLLGLATVAFLAFNNFGG